MLNNFVKIFVTLGSAIAAYLIGILLQLDKKHATASSAFFMLSALLLPIGIYVTFNLFNIHVLQNSINVIISGICFSVFLFSHLYVSRTIFLLFTILFGSVFFVSFCYFITNQSNFIFENLSEYELITLGLSYLFFGRYLDFDKSYPLIGPLYFFGGLFILAGSYMLGGFVCLNTGILFWKILTPILILTTFLLSITLNSKSLLYLGAIFLVIYITDMSVWFADIFGNLGWPLILVFIGFTLMFVGYLVFNIHKKINYQNKQRERI